MERAFNFKLLVPPRTNLGQVSTVKPQDSGFFEDNTNISFKPQGQGYNKCFNKETSLPLSNKNTVLPTKSPRAEHAKRIAVMPMEKEETLRSSQLYSKLFEEVDKVKSWKLKMDSEIFQKERKIQENRKTVETQRKAIQELQFENERLSMKLEEQINENEDQRNKTLCNILKDTFERSTEKMGLFEAEREETHSLFLQNNENIQRMVDAFENLRMQAEADQTEMLRVRQGLQKSEDLKLKFENEFHLKEDEIFILEEKLKEKENNIKEILLDLQETQHCINELQESTRQHQELLQKSKQEQDILEAKLKQAEQLREEAEGKQKSLANIVEQTKEIHIRDLQERDIKLEKVNDFKEQLEHQLRENQVSTESLESSLASVKKRVHKLESELCSMTDELSKKNIELGKIRQEKEEQESQIQTLKDEMDTHSVAVKSLEEKVNEDMGKILLLTVENEEKQDEISDLKKKLEITSDENKAMLASLDQVINEKKQIKEHAILKEIKLKDIEEQLSETLKKATESSNNLTKMKKDVDLHKEKYKDLLERFNYLQLQKNTIEQQVEGGVSETKVLELSLKESQENEKKMKMEIQGLEMEKLQLQTQVEVLSSKIEVQFQENENIQKQNKDSQSELMKKERLIKALDLKLSNLKSKLETKSKTQDEHLKENKALKKQMALEHEKCSQYEAEIVQLKEALQNLKEYHKDELKRIGSEIENKSTSEIQLRLEVEKLTQTTMEAMKSKEDTEIKCQQKITDMIALMERHKREYDKMVEEKDAELKQKRIQEAEVKANKTSLDLELSHLHVENGKLKQQLEKLKMEKENLQQKVEDLTKIQTSQKDRYIEKEENLEQNIIALKKQTKCLEKDKTQKISEMPPTISKCSKIQDVASTNISLSKEPEIETPSRDVSTPVILGDSHLKTPSWTLETKIGMTPRIRSFRIRTPPSIGKEPWQINTLELDPRSDSSEQSDILNFSAITIKPRKPMQAKETGTECLGQFKKVQNSAMYKSPGEALKLAAMKRMRDAGWTTVTSLGKKRKKAADKIFA
ncbi:synaptonemal complex protein 1 isoform X2 [Brachyhypopomus gauderio]|uniref:synaptonemal complex protein 1 isoform X2 n=1 Tax=Brachyhypopomus gauderio TaxID=698409 RepID=UPI00404168E4